MAMLITKDSLKKYEFLEICFEDYPQCYLIPVKYVLDIHFDVEKAKDDEHETVNTKGMIKLSPLAKKLKAKDEWDSETLFKYLQITPGIVGVSFIDNEKNELFCAVEHNPVYKIACDCVWKHVNTSSFEEDKEGNLILKFGKLSNAPRCIHNNYADLIRNWHEYMQGFDKQLLEVYVTSISSCSFGLKKDEIGVIISLEKNARESYCLLFHGCKEDVYYFDYEHHNCKHKVIIEMSKVDNYIYVNIGEYISFKCKSVEMFEV